MREANRVPITVSATITILIHALREEGDIALQLKNQAAQISIHALREEGDLRALAFAYGGDISIHALREEGDILHYCRHHIH